jgi:hypothetical protein
MGNDPMGTRELDEDPDCPVHPTNISICGGPHRVVQTDLGAEVLAPSEGPIGTPDLAAAIPMVIPDGLIDRADARSAPSGKANPLIPTSQSEIDQRD